MTPRLRYRSRIRWLAVLTALASTTFGLDAAGTTAFAARSHGSSLASPSDPLDPRIAELAKRSPNRAIETIVQFTSHVTMSRARADARSAGGRVIGEVALIHGLAVRLSAAHAVRLARAADVHAVSLNAPVVAQGQPSLAAAAQLQSTFNQSLDAPGLWQLGGTGAHIGVAVIDSGVDGNLPDFRSPDGSGSRVIATAVTNPSAKTVMDTYGHGTDVAAVVAGNGAGRPASDPLRGSYSGVAPDANVISIKVSDDQGNANVLNVINGIQFAVDFRERYNIRVINLSLSSTTVQPYQTDPLDAAVESAWLHGIVVVVAAGNRGTDPAAVQYAPANDPYVVTVGAVDEHGTADVTNHSIADWSSRGTTQDGTVKPDVYAPGAHIVSDLAPASAFASMCSACIVDGQYIRASGTSLAAPMIAGLVADLLDLHHQWTPDQVKGALMSPLAWSDSLPEVNALSLAGFTSPPTADQGLTPNPLLAEGAGGGGVDYTKSSWNKSSWNVATGPLGAGFTKSSWNCSCVSGAGTVNPTKSSWNSVTWGTDGFQ